MIKAKKFIISQILFFITISLIANKAFFSHIHILPDGEIVVHAHPYSKKGDAPKNVNHNHTKFSFYVIDQSGRFDDVPVEFQEIDFKGFYSDYFYPAERHVPINPFYLEFIDSRGPPVVLA